MEATGVLDPAAQHTADAPPADWDGPDEPLEGAPEEPRDLDVGDDYAPGPMQVALIFETDVAAIEDAATAWRRALELIDSAKAKGLVLVAGNVEPGQDVQGEAREAVEAALAEIAGADEQ